MFLNISLTIEPVETVFEADGLPILLLHRLFRIKDVRPDKSSTSCTGHGRMSTSGDSEVLRNL